jgi:uncharacterized damage-inducible protein DinB
MPTSDIQQILLAHDAWATQQMIDACRKLTPGQFHQRFDMGPGSLHDTIAHILGAAQTWTLTLAGQPRTIHGQRVDQDGQKRTPDQLTEVLRDVDAGLRKEAARLPLHETVTREREGKVFEFTRGVVLAHVATHAMHHRAQCLNMLKQLGVKPLPPSSVSEWSRMADAKA